MNKALQARLDSLEARNASLEAENAKLASKLQFCEVSLNNLEQYSHCECVKISGILEAEDENTKEIAIKAISHTPLVAMPSRPPQPDLYSKLKKCIHIITLER